MQPRIKTTACIMMKRKRTTAGILIEVIRPKNDVGLATR